MAVAYDAGSESHGGTTGSTSEASFSFTHTPVGSPKGVLVFVIQDTSSTDDITSVTYDGTTVPAVSGGLAAAATGEPRLCKAFFLGTGIPTGAKTVVVNRTNNSTVMWASAITVTAGANTEVYTPGIVLVQAAAAAITSENVTDGSTGVDSVRFCGYSIANNSPGTAGTASTAIVSIDFGNQAAGTIRETTPGQGSRPVGTTGGGANDDVAAVYLAVREVTAVNGTATPSATAGTGAVPAPSASGSFSPSQIAGLKIWLKADAGAGASDNDPVATWTDQSGTSHSFTQATSGKRPLYKTNILNGLPVVRFDGTDDQLDAGDLSATFPSAATVFGVAIQTGGTGKLMVYSTKNNDSWWRFTGGEGYWGDFRSTRLAATPGSGLSGTGWHVWSNTGNGTAYKMWIDRSQQINAGSYTFDGGNAHTLGWQQTNNEYPAMDLAELIVYDTALSDADRTAVEDYLYAKWALLVAFPPVVAGVGAVPAPTAFMSGDIVATPSTVVGTGAVPAASAKGAGRAVVPAAVAGIADLPNATGKGASFASPATVVGTGAVPAPTAFAPVTVTPSTTVGIGAVPAATGLGTSVAAPATVAGVGAVPLPNAMGAGSGNANPLATVGIGAVPAVTAFATGKASPSATAGVGAVPAATGKGTSSVSPSTVAGTGVVPGPITGATQNGTALPSNVIAIGRVPHTIGMGVGTGGGGGTPNGATDFWAIKVAS